jgi:hypothetical protein
LYVITTNLSHLKSQQVCIWQCNLKSVKDTEIWFLWTWSAMEKACCKMSKTVLVVCTIPSFCQNHHVLRDKNFFTNFCIVYFTASCFL